MSGTENQVQLRQYLENQGIFSWHSYLTYLRKAQNITQGPKHLNSYHVASKADSMMNAVYLGCNIVTLALVLTAFFLPQIAWLPIVAFVIGAAWNYFDAVAGLVVARYQNNIGDRLSAGANIFSSAQLTAATTVFSVVFLGLASSSLLTVISIVAGFGFAMAMGISALLEYRAMKQCEQRIQKLEQLLSSESSPLQNPLTEELQNQLTTYLQIERQQAQSHKHNAKVWLACFIAMTAIATIGLLPIAAPAQALLLILAAVLCCITAMYRIRGEARAKPLEPLTPPLQALDAETGLKPQATMQPAPKQNNTQEMRATAAPAAPPPNDEFHSSVIKPPH